MTSDADTHEMLTAGLFLFGVLLFMAGLFTLPLATDPWIARPLHESLHRAGLVASDPDAGRDQRQLILMVLQMLALLVGLACVVVALWPARRARPRP